MTEGTEHVAVSSRGERGTDSSEVCGSPNDGG